MNDTTDATAILAPIWRRKWMILLVAILVAAGTYLYYKRQPTVYPASTQMYLGAGSEEQGCSTSKRAKAPNERRYQPDDDHKFDRLSKRTSDCENGHHLAAARGNVHAKALREERVRHAHR